MLRQRVTRSKDLNRAMRQLEAERLGLGGWAGTIATWMIAFQDREGRVKADVGWIQQEILPEHPRLSADLIEHILSVLALHGAFLYYRDDAGHRYIQFEGIHRCNRIPPGEPVSVLPEPAPDRLVVRPDPAVRSRYQCCLDLSDTSLPCTSSGTEGKEGKEERKNTLAPPGARVCAPSSNTSAPFGAGPASSHEDSSPPAFASASGQSSIPAVPGPAFALAASPPPDEGSPSSLASAASLRRQRSAPPPFTVAFAVRLLQSHSAGRIRLDPFPANFAAPVVHLIRAFPVPDDWQLVAEAFAAGLESWRTSPIDARALVKAGNFELWLGAARKWHADGRPSLRTNGKRTAATGLLGSASRVTEGFGG